MEKTLIQYVQNSEGADRQFEYFALTRAAEQVVSRINQYSIYWINQYSIYCTLGHR